MAEERAKDPVCGMEVGKDNAQGPVEHMGKIFYFCSAGCKEKFEKEPMEYAGEKGGEKE